MPSRPPTASPSRRLGVHNPTPKLQSLLSQEWLKLRTATLADTFTWSIRTQAHEKFWRKGSVGVSRDCPFFWVPLLSQERVNRYSYELQTWQVYSDGPCKQKPIKNVEENGAWAYTASAQIFWVPPIISGTDKATNFKFGRYFHRVHPNKSPLKFWEKMERGRIQGLPQFFEYPQLSQELVKLRPSNFVRVFMASIGRKVH